VFGVPVVTANIITLFDFNLSVKPIFKALKYFCKPFTNGIAINVYIFPVKLTRDIRAYIWSFWYGFLHDILYNKDTVTTFK